MAYLLSDLQVFQRAANAISLSAAARQLDLTPAGVSASIKRLEQSLGARLFERSARVLRLTPAGQAFLQASGTALAALAEGEQAVREGQAGADGEIRLAAPSDLARTLLNDLLARFMARHPQLRVVMLLSDAVHDLLRDAVDLAVRYGEPQDSRLVARPLCTTRRIACASPDYVRRHGVPATPQALAEHDCIVYQVRSRLDNTWVFTQGADAVNVTVSGRLATDDSALARQWAVEGRGIVCKSDLDLADDLRHGRLVPLLAAWQGECVPLHAVHTGQRQLPRRVRLLLDFLAESLHEKPGRQTDWPASGLTATFKL